MKIKSLLALALMISSMSVFAEATQRNCVLLPVTQVTNQKLGYQIFDLVEDGLKDSSFCNYRPNSGIVDILNNYRNNVNTYLKNKEVLKLISEKTNAGSLIRISINSEIQNHNLKIEVIGANGEDVYYKAAMNIDKLDPEWISQVVLNWLRVYGKEIPYDARVVGIVGNTVTIDAGSDYGIRIGDEVQIVKPIRKKRHPLLKEVIDWDTKMMARGKVATVNNDQSTVKITEYNSRAAIKAEDWIRATHTINTEPVMSKEDAEKYRFGKLGAVGVFFNAGLGVNEQSFSGESKQEMSGYLLGISTKVDLWVTRNWWGSFELSKNYGNYEHEKGSRSVEDNSVDTFTWKLKGGYKFLPMGFFYGPQIDLYTGIGSFTYAMDNDLIGSLTESKYRGLILGIRGELPFMEKYRAFAKLELMPTGSYKEDPNIHNSDDEIFGYDFEIGATMAMNPLMSVYGSLNFISNKAELKDGDDPVQNVKHGENVVKLGAIFTF